MFYPSGIVFTFKSKATPRAREDGMMTFADAYEGVHEYFEGKPDAIIRGGVHYYLEEIHDAALMATLRGNKTLQLDAFVEPDPKTRKLALHDGLYGAVENGSPAYAIIHGKLYALSMQVPEAFKPRAFAPQ